jgi:hypothetical protein
VTVAVDFFSLTPEPRIVAQHRVTEVLFFAPNWCRKKTMSLAPKLDAIKAFALAACLCGVSNEEIEDDLEAAWPELAERPRVGIEASGTRLIVEFSEPCE